MRRTLFLFLRGFFVSIAMLISWLFTTIAIVLGGALACLLIYPPLIKKGVHALNFFGLLWARTCRVLLLMGNRHKWHCQDSQMLDKTQWYLLICNHRSWGDIILLNMAFGHTMPIFKYFLKKQLLWSLPIGGLACWVLGFPFIERYTREQIRKNPALKQKNIDNINTACEQFKTSPTTIINFVEGTRFTPEKHQQQKAPFKHLLKPKLQGIAMVINALPTEVKTLLNVTVRPTPHTLGLWDLLSGNYDRITIRFTTQPIDDRLRGDFFEDRTYRRTMQAWLNALWEEKDKELENIDSNSEKDRQ